MNKILKEQAKKQWPNKKSKQDTMYKIGTLSSKTEPYKNHNKKGYIEVKSERRKLWHWEGGQRAVTFNEPSVLYVHTL